MTTLMQPYDEDAYPYSYEDAYASLREEFEERENDLLDVLHERYEELQDELREDYRTREYELEKDYEIQRFKDDVTLGALEAENARQALYLQMGAGAGVAVLMGGIVAHMRQKKTHESVMKVLEEVAVSLRNETEHLNLDDLAAVVFDKVGSIEVRSFRHPFAIKLSELERAMNLLTELLRTTEMIALRHADENEHIETDKEEEQ